MEQRSIGQSALKIAPIIFGGNVFGWTVDEKRSFELLDAFTGRGFNCVDTADVYSRFAPGLQGGESETIIGSWLKKGGGRRDNLVICTKVGMEMGPGKIGLKPAYIEQAVEASLRRLQTDYIDLYISHIDDPETPVEETLGAYARLIEAGKVRAIGASNYSPERLSDALEASQKGLPRYESLQPLYNLYDRAAYEGPLQAVCEKYQLSVTPFFALASGFLTGKYRSAKDVEGQQRKFLVDHYVDERGLRILAAMDEIAAATDLTLPQIALSWLLSRPTITAPIASASKLSQLDTLLAAAETSLTDDQLSALEKASA